MASLAVALSESNTRKRITTILPNYHGRRGQVATEPNALKCSAQHPLMPVYWTYIFGRLERLKVELNRTWQCMLYK